jgi:2-oxoisovalerate dehydrogenase E2 component (dihydrolipoyl transacylase)
VSRYVFKLPDLGEGTVEAEIVGWHVKPGDVVAEEDVIVEVMTEKAAVEVPAPVSGRVISTTGTPGDMVPVGADLIVFETGAGDVEETAEAHAEDTAEEEAIRQDIVKEDTVKEDTRRVGNGHASAGDSRPQAGVTHAGRVATSPAIRRRAHEAGIDLTQLSGSGPNGRILREDFDAFVANRSSSKSLRPGTPEPQRAPPVEEVEEIKVIGVRRLIAQRMSESKRNIPHFAYVEEVDVTELESLRQHLNSKLQKGVPTLTFLPFIIVALVRVLEDFPQCNAQYDSERNVIIRHRSVHVGVATQTPDGLKVPVVRNAQSRSLWDLADEIRRVSDAARSNKAGRNELTGSTITVTSLGKLGGIVTTPIINAPEVAIVGINRAVERPVVYEGAITVRRMMNLSSSFDHRFVDGYDAAAMIQALKERLEHPATLFIDGPKRN